MMRYAALAAEELKTVAAAADVKIEQTTGLPMVSIEVDRAAVARYGLNASDVQDVVSLALGGEAAGQVMEGDRRFDIIVRLPDELRNNIDDIGRLPVAIRPVAGANGREDASGPGFVPLSSVAKINLAAGAKQIRREDGKRRVVVTANVRGRDLGGFVAEAQAKVRARLGRLPEGYWLGWGGQFENFIAAKKRLSVVVPLVLGLIFVLLFASFGTIRHSLLVFTGVPFALTGGVLALWLRGLHFSISAGVGFIALSGVAVLNGLVLVSFIGGLRKAGLGPDEAVMQGCLTRLRPVLMTALVASIGFVPMALAQGMGAEVQRPLATVVIGGVISSTLLTLLVLPAIYGWFERFGKGDV
jgi:heavy metal efflux system protein